MNFTAVKKMLPELLERGAVVVDVRRPEEYVAGSAPGSRNIPLADLKERAGELDKEKPVIVCCATGMRSASAAKTLVSLGFRDVVNAGPWKNVASPLVDHESSGALEGRIRGIAGVFILTSLGLAHWIDPRFLWLTAFVGASLLFSAFTGFCMMGELLRKAGLGACLALLAVGASHAAAPAKKLLHDGLVAELDENDDLAAQTYWKKCLSMAPPKSDEAGDCGLYADMFGKGRPDPSRDAVQATAMFAAGMLAFHHQDDSTARLRWHDCIDLSEAGTLIRDKCMAALDLLPARKTSLSKGESKARADLTAGAAAYATGDLKKAKTLWERCAAEADATGSSVTDCRAGLEKLSRTLTPR